MSRHVDPYRQRVPGTQVRRLMPSGAQPQVCSWVELPGGSGISQTCKQSRPQLMSHSITPGQGAHQLAWAEVVSTRSLPRGASAVWHTCQGLCATHFAVIWRKMSSSAVPPAPLQYSPGASVSCVLPVRACAITCMLQP